MVMTRKWITRSLLLLLLLNPNPKPGEIGTETAERDLRSIEENMAVIVRYLHALLSGPLLDPYN
jgi:hypothetical protein